MVITDKTPKEYIDSLEKESKEVISKLHKLILKVSPKGTKPVMWEGVFWGGSEQSIIGYGVMSYTKSDNKVSEWFAIGLTKQKNYITVFINAVEDKQYVADKYKDLLGKVKVGKSSISFNKLKNVNLNGLEIMIKKAFEITNRVN